MAAPEPDNPLPPQNILKSLIEAFNKLPAPLSYGGLIFVVIYLFIYTIGDFPVYLLAVPLLALVAFLIYAYIERHFELQRRQADLAHKLQEKELDLQHTEKMTHLERSQPTPREAPDASAVEGDDVSPNEWERRYLDHLMALCEYPPSMALIDIKEAGLGSHKLALDRIFTSLEAPASQEGHDPSRLAIDLDRLEEEERIEREAVLATISRQENDKLVILGAPGSGKSTLVNYLTLCLAGDRLAGEHGLEIIVTQDHLRQYGWELGHLRLWPVRMILREYAARGLSKGQNIWEFIVADLSRPGVKLAGYADILKKRLQEEGGILLLDGLDEVDKAAGVRKALKRNIELFARDFHRVRVLVTSRPYAYGSGWELQNFHVTRLLPFSEEQIEFFVEQWYRVMGQVDPTLGPEKAKDYSDSLIGQIKQIPNLREMAQHPLLLTMMVYIHRGREGGALPERREELYRLCVILLLDLWRRSKSIPGQERQTLAEELGMGTEVLQNALAEVAFIAHRDQPEQKQTADIPGALVAGTLYKNKSKESDIDLDNIIEYVRDRAGLLEEHGRNADDSDDVYRFPHRTFQEYLAAMYLLNAPDFPRELASLARQDATRWREAVLLAGAAARPAMRWALVEALYEGKKLPSPGAGMAAEDWWGAFLAGQVLAENDMHLDPPSMHQEKLDRVQAWHKGIVEQGMLPPLDRGLAGQVLAELGDDRPGVGVSKKDGMLIPEIAWGKEVPAKTYEIGGDRKAYDSFDKQKVEIERPYRLSRYPITNAQFQCFIDAPDRDDRAWWEDIPAQEQIFDEAAFPYANHPRERISWYQAIAFCRWLSNKLGEGVDLPHEYEWEAAARYPGSRFYPWGRDFDADKANIAREIGQTTAVGMYPNGRNAALDLYDLSGNVWEWCRNEYKKPDDEWVGKDPVDRSDEARVVRGGSWLNLQHVARAAARNLSHPASRDANDGFRVVARRPPSQNGH